MSHKVLDKKGVLKLDNKSTVVTNNLYFGSQYIKINKCFKNSPFISKKCRACMHYKKFVCRGLLNIKFLEKKEEILERYGKENYHAIRSDYENGMFLYGSQCSEVCRFCLDKYLPNGVIRPAPTLTCYEVSHFLHYLPDFISMVGCTYHCKSGEFFESHHSMEIFRNFLQFFFVKGPNMMITNGKRLTKDKLDVIKESRISKRINIGISVNTFNEKIRKSLCLPDVNYKEKIAMLKESGLTYNVSLVPLKTTVESGDIFKTFHEIYNIDENCTIRMQFPEPNKFLESDIIEEMNFDYESLKRRIKSQFPDKQFIIIDELDQADPGLIKKVFSKIKEFCSGNKKYLMLCPDRTYPLLSGMSSDSVIIKHVKSSLGFTNTCSGLLLIRDYISAIDEKDYDFVLLPKNALTANFEDFSLDNINSLWDCVRKKSASIVII